MGSPGDRSTSRPRSLGAVSTSNNFCGKGASIYIRLTSGPLRAWTERQIQAWEAG